MTTTRPSLFTAIMQWGHQCALSDMVVGVRNGWEAFYAGKIAAIMGFKILWGYVSMSHNRYP